jgi:acetoacetyl-CoA reductase
MTSVAFVTGGAGGIGQAICKRLADANFRVASSYIAAEKDIALKWQEDSKGAGYDYMLVEGDVSNFESSAAMVRQVEEQLGPIEVLVNCAGITRDGTFRKMTEEQWNAVVNINLNGVFNVTRQVINGMIDRGYGRVVNISSMNGQKGQFGQSNYAATKAGIHGFTMSLAQEVASKGITVNSISPGYIGTSMVMAIPEAVRNKIVAQIPVGRMGTPDEVGALVAFLASEDAGYITGANVAMNGGQHMQF